MKRNPFFSQISPHFLFSEMAHRICQFKKEHPDVRLISLGVGDTTEPLGPSTADCIAAAATHLKDPDLYTGYGPEQGLASLRKKISSVLYQNAFSHDEIFISDGIKSEVGKLLILFGPKAMCACLEPSYPAYADASCLTRLSHPAFFCYLPCLSLDTLSLSTVPDGAIVFLCSPNNPTGEVFSFSKFRSLVLEAKRRHLILVLDTTYRAFIQGDLPRSIYEIEGSKEVAIEIGSFSKMAGFSGIRLGWTVIPHELTSEDGFSLHHDYQRLVSTIFNGASILSQKGGLQALSPTGQKECERQINVYRNNTLLLQKTFVKKDFPVWGGKHAPYIWVKIRHRSSWEAFEYFLQKAGVIVTPGIGFGPSGEGYIRICGFGNPSTIEEAVTRISML